MKRAPNTECHKYGSNVNMKVAVASCVDYSCSSINQCRNQRPYFILSIFGILPMEVGKDSNKSKNSVKHSYDFQLAFVPVIQHGRNSFDCMLNENCSVLQSVQKNTAHQQCTSRGIASFNTTFGFVYLYRHNNHLLRQYHSSLFYSTYLYSIQIFITKHKCNLHTTECICLYSYYKALNKTYSSWFLVVFPAKTENPTFTANIKASRCWTETAIKQFCNYIIYLY